MFLWYGFSIDFFLPSWLYCLSSNSINAQANRPTGFTSFDSDGFTVDAGGTICNVSSRTYVGWTWRIDGSNLTNVPTSGDVSVSTLRVTHNASIGGTLSVVGAVGFNSTATIAGATHLQSTLSVGGAATFASTVTIAGNTTLTGTLLEVK